MQSPANYKISIVTVAYNAARFIEPTIQSIINLQYPSKEYIIIDGKSNDSTLKIIEKYKNHIDYFVSEADGGLFIAMNKGIAAASGDWIIFINAGDLIYDRDIIKRIDFDAYKDKAILYGNTYDIGFSVRKPFPITSLNSGIIMACHQSMLFNKNILKDELYYDEQYKFYNDYELVARVVKKKYKVHYIDVVIASYLGGGYSSRISWKARLDKYKIMFKLYGILGVVRAAIYKIWRNEF